MPKQSFSRRGHLPLSLSLNANDVNNSQAILQMTGQELSIRFRSWKKQKNLKAGTLFKKAQDEIHGQILQILKFFKHR